MNDSIFSGSALRARILGTLIIGLSSIFSFSQSPTNNLPNPTNSGIGHIVLVMMENRSFDHLLGWLPGADGKQGGLTYTDRSGTAHPTMKLAPDFQGCGHPDPDHSYAGGRIELNNGACDGWLRAGSNDVYSIGYYDKADLPFLGAAAKAWTVCDHYFAAILAGTYPNRIYQHAAQTDRLDNSLTPSQLPTIWDRLSDKSVSARYYFSDVPLIALWGAKYLPIVRPVTTFYSDCASGTLPEVSFVEPSFLGEDQGISQDDHPHGDVRAGETFLNKVYSAITSSPNWTNTVLVINFDEWGGFFDHVAPTNAPIPAADRAAGDTNGLRGFRVPCLVISPLARRGSVQHGIYDHTSVLKFIEWRFGLDALTVRDGSANNLAEVLDFSQTNKTAPVFDVPTGPYGLPCPTAFTIARSTNGPVLSWLSGGLVQTSLSVTGAWQDVQTTASSYQITNKEPVRFFRFLNEQDSLLALARKYGF